MRTTRKFSQGFGVIGVIILITVLALLGFGGYTGYQYATNPAFDFYGLARKTPSFIPQDLVPLVEGKNAEFLLAYSPETKLTLKLDEFLANFQDLPVRAADIKSALGAAISPKTAGNLEGAFIFAVRFASPEKAQTMRDRSAFLTTLMRIIVELDGDTVLYKLHPELLEGSILDNALLQKSHPRWEDSQLGLLLLDASKATGYSSVASILAAGAGAESPTSMESMGYFIIFIEGHAKTEENTLHIHMSADLMDRDEIRNIVPPEGFTTDSLMTAYDEMLKNLDEEIQNLNALQDKPEAITHFRFDRIGLHIQGEIGIDLSKIEPLPDPSVKERDDVRKNDINTLVAAFETYHGAKGSYPDSSQCADHLKTEMADFLPYGMPVDPKGARTFGSESCLYGYYYQYFGGGTYAVWSQMEDENNGNSVWPLIIESPADVLNVKTAVSGPYYVWISGSGNVSGESTQEMASESQVATQETSAVRKVKRTLTPVFTQETAP